MYKHANDTDFKYFLIYPENENELPIYFGNIDDWECCIVHIDRKVLVFDIPGRFPDSTEIRKYNANYFELFNTKEELIDCLIEYTTKIQDPFKISYYNVLNFLQSCENETIKHFEFEKFKALRNYYKTQSLIEDKQDYLKTLESLEKVGVIEYLIDETNKHIKQLKEILALAKRSVNKS